jgi:hypothetical protein
MNNKYGPMFGGGSNFYICEKANQNESSGFFISTS